MAKKLTTVQKLQRALVRLDNAVQAYYAEVDEENKDRYASVHIRNYEDGTHASSLTLFAKLKYVDIRSNKDTVLNRED